VSTHGKSVYDFTKFRQTNIQTNMTDSVELVQVSHIYSLPA